MALRAAASLSLRIRTFQGSARGTSIIRMASSAAGPASSYFVLRYDYVSDILEKRGPYREAHLRGAQDKLASGNLVCAGATGSPPDGAMFLFKDTSQQDIEAFVQADPYFKNGLVTSYNISPYIVVVGAP